MILYILFTHFFVFSFVVFAQTSIETDRFRRTTQSVLTSLTESIEWYDLPITGIMMSRDLYKLDYDDRLIVSTSHLEEYIQNQIGHTGRTSFGSIDKNTLPMAIIYTRLAYALGSDLILNDPVSKDEYKNILLFGKSLMYTYTITELIKDWTYRDRPDGSDYRSFFSGHTSTAFVTASYLYREFDTFFNNWEFTANNKELKTLFKASAFSALYGYAGYVATSRMKDNKHYLSDVLIGAAVGTLIGNLVYGNYFQQPQSNCNVGLNLINDAPSVYLNFSF